MAIGALILMASVLLLRTLEIPLFVEQLGAPGLLIGTSLVVIYSTPDTSGVQSAINTALVIASLLVVPVRQAWIRTLLGVAIGLLAATSLSAGYGYWWKLTPTPLACSVVTSLWVLLQTCQRVLVLDVRSARIIGVLEAVSGGIAVAALTSMIWSSGRTFLLGDTFGLSMDESVAAVGIDTTGYLSVGLALTGGAWLALRWPLLRTWWYAALIIPGMTLAWVIPTLGSALLILSLCIESRRRVLGTFAGFTTIWMIGGLYYASVWPLALKAILLTCVGLALALVGRYAIAEPLALAEPEPLPQALPHLAARRVRAGFLSCGLLVLGTINVAIWNKEHVIRTGNAVYVEMAPVDPRSLMQGDYMRLYFRLPTESPPERRSGSATQVVLHLDGRGVGKVLGFHDGRQLAKGEIVVDVVLRHGAWTFVTDAWYFKEGEAARWSRARYGEFRVAPDGKALLVGLRGPNLEKL
jgi:uncharacterized membrane-anchored protein